MSQPYSVLSPVGRPVARDAGGGARRPAGRMAAGKAGGNTGSSPPSVTRFSKPAGVTAVKDKDLVLISSFCF